MAGSVRAMLFGLLALAVLTGATGHAQTPAQGAQAGQSSGAPAGQPPAQDPTPDAPQPVFRAGINFVRVDVIVMDRQGNPVMDLKPEDFQVTEGGVPQTVETFKLIGLDGGLMPAPDGPPREIRTDLDEETEASRDDVRLFGIFLDDYHVQRTSSLQARDQIARFVETQLGPSDMVGLMRPLQPLDSVRMTRNHAAIQGGIRQFLGRKYDFTPMNEMEQRYAYYPTETVMQIRRQVSMTAIRAFISKMGGLKEGRKALILVSEGFTALPPPQLRDSMAAIPGSGNPARGNPNAGVGDIAENRANWSAQTTLEDEMRDIYAAAARNNVAIYTVDPRGLATNEFGIDQNIGMTQDRQSLMSSMETLRALALNTDGRAILNRNDLTIGMRQIVRDTSAYYLLGYNSSYTATDGKFHEIKVQVKRPGIQVRARKGYWAYTADDAVRATTPAPASTMPPAYTTALTALASPNRNRVVRTWVGAERGTDGKTRVTFVWEPVARPPGDRSPVDNAPARIALTAAGTDGMPYYRGRTPTATAAAPGTMPVGTTVTFEAKPGPMQLRLSVENGAAEVIDSEVRDVLVPDLAGTATTIATPEVFRARTVRDYQQLKTSPQAVPTAVREFTRTDRVFVRVTGYGPDAEPPAVTAQLLTRTGQLMNALTPAPVAGSPGTFDFDLTLSAMAPGEYLIEIAAAGGSEPVKEIIAFRITG